MGGHGDGIPFRRMLSETFFCTHCGATGCIDDRCTSYNFTANDKCKRCGRYGTKKPICLFEIEDAIHCGRPSRLSDLIVEWTSARFAVRWFPRNGRITMPVLLKSNNDDTTGGTPLNPQLFGQL